ncbi:MAG: enoyl-CoA hydratase/isomerase family protein [Actinobacteria bacterium]|nr:enoyl-CoA hydratase/isomerase family protein [Actinomycetota bacterium]
MSAESVVVSLERGVGLVSVQQGDSSIDRGALLDRFLAALEDLGGSADIYCVALEGLAFVGPHDYGLQTECPPIPRSASGATDLSPLRRAIIRSMLEMDKPVVGLLAGRIAGFALDVALACDIRVAAESTRVQVDFVERGSLPGHGTPWHLAQLVGRGRAAELAFCAGELDVVEARRLGLVTLSVSSDELGIAGRKLARHIAVRYGGTTPFARRLRGVLAMGQTQSIFGLDHGAVLGPGVARTLN